VLEAPNAAEHGSDTAAEVRHVNRQAGMAVQHAGIDQANHAHDERELASDRARRVEGVELLGPVELERRMDENEHPALLRFRPKRLELRRIDEEAVELRADDDARKTQIRRAARKLFESIRA